MIIVWPRPRMWDQDRDWSFYASTPPNVVWLEAYCICPVRPGVLASVCASRKIVNTISCRVFDTFLPNLHQRFTNGQRWTLHNLGSKYPRSRSWWNEVCWKQHILCLLTRCFEKYYLVRFSPKLTSVMYYGTEVNALSFGVKRSKFKVTME